MWCSVAAAQPKQYSSSVSSSFTRNSGVKRSARSFSNQSSRSTKIDASNKTLAQLFSDAVQRFEFKDCIRDTAQNTRWTYNEMQTHLTALANGFLELPLSPGDRIASLWQNQTENLLSHITASRIGASVVFLNSLTHSLDDQRLFCLKTKPRALMFTPRQTETSIEHLHKLIPETKDYLEPVGKVRLESIPSIQYIINGSPSRNVNGTVRFASLMEYRKVPDLLTVRGGIRENPLISDPNHLNTIYPLADRNIIGSTVGQTAQRLSALGAALRLSTEDRLVYLPSFATPLAVDLAWSCIVNGSVYTIPYASVSNFNPELVFKTLTNERATMLVATPQQLEQLVQFQLPANKFDISSLKTVIIQGSEGDNQAALLNAISGSALRVVNHVFSLNHTTNTLSELTAKSTATTLPPFTVLHRYQPKTQ